MDSRIENLVQYARNQGDADRTALFRNLVDLFLAQDAPADSQFRQQLLNVLTALIPHVDESTRETAAGLIASMPKVPMDLVLQLVQDEAHLVRELLHKVDFDEDDLIDLIERTGRAHHQEIAARPNLSANVWIALARAAPNRNNNVGIPDTRLFDADLTSEQAIQPTSTPATSATVTALDPTKLPGDAVPTHTGFRVLRSGENLRDDENTDNISEKKPNIAKLQPPLPAFLREPKAGHVADPAANGWAFRSNRDGFITHLSPNALRLFANSTHALGDALLDFLGLNSKLGHPVARAFQRRSQIEDAPLYIDGCPKGMRYWQLSAVPRFSTETGSFDGYDGRLGPVASESAEPIGDNNRPTVPPQTESIVEDFLSEQPIAAETDSQAGIIMSTDVSETMHNTDLESPVQHDSFTGDSFENFLDQIPGPLINDLEPSSPWAKAGGGAQEPQQEATESPQQQGQTPATAQAAQASQAAPAAAAPANQNADIGNMLMQQLQSAMAQMQAETKEAIETEMARLTANTQAAAPAAVEKSQTMPQQTAQPAQAGPQQAPAAPPANGRPANSFLLNKPTVPPQPLMAPATEESPDIYLEQPDDSDDDAPVPSFNGSDATLDMLSNAVDMFLSHAKESGNLSLRLQAEIAMACIRTLRDAH